MKKTICLLLSACLGFGVLAGCSSGVSQEDFDKLMSENSQLQSQIDSLQDSSSSSSDSSNVSDTNSEDEISLPFGSFDEEKVISQLEVTTYAYTDSIGTRWVVAAIKNNSDYDIQITMDGQFKDANGTLVGTSKEDDYAFEKGSEIALTFMNDGDYATFDYKISVEQLDYFECVWSGIQCEANITPEKAIITATNNGDKPAEFLSYVVVFFNGGTPVYSSDGYLIDDDSELKPGQSESSEARCYETFDSVKVFYNGRYNNLF